MHPIGAGGQGRQGGQGSNISPLSPKAIDYFFIWKSLEEREKGDRFSLDVEEIHGQEFGIYAQKGVLI
ncbi:hypothetical protein [Nostoc sp.]|uniref:hypothetical protein n=1 Tax=Nostoc sp. TaxID=1180 RepID=UPI002FF86D18